MCGSPLHIRQYLKIHMYSREAKVRHPTAIKTHVRGTADEGSPALACSSVEGEGVACGRTGTVKTSRGVGAAVGAHVTSGRQSALVNV